MVWDQDIKLLVMLCQQESDTNSECMAYWESQYQKSTNNQNNQVHFIVVSEWHMVDKD